MPDSRPEIAVPPWPDGAEGAPRSVGIELEFGHLTAAQAASVVTAALGEGAVSEARDSHRYRIEPPPGGAWRGSFTVELDTRWAHPDYIRERAGELADGLDETLPRKAAELWGEVAGLVMPVEMVAPPIGWPDLDDILPLVEALRNAGATGTEHSAFAGFGMHLNVEAARLDVEHLLAVLRAYVLLAPRLRRESNLAAIRRMQSYIDPFPVDYARHILARDYRPDLAQLIDDHIRFNPTRNMELDMLPLFAHLDAARVRRRLPDEKIGARPTFHWRLPDCRIDEPDWQPLTAWRRWVMVERLAADPREMAALSRTFLAKGPRWEIEARLARIISAFE